MDTISLSQLLMLYTWFGLAVLVFFLILIARFYGRFSGDRTRYLLFILPLIGYGAAAVRYASIERSTDDLAGDLLAAVSGVLLIILVARLYHLMTANRK